MERKSAAFSILLAVLNCVFASSWNNLNCPAPRAPDNGLSFIFRNGELIHFRCHPGYMMLGKGVTHCVNNRWTHPAPECIPIKNSVHPFNHTFGQEVYDRRSQVNPSNYSKKEKQRQLFNWDEGTTLNGAYGDGPRRLPLINGIWPPQEYAEQVLALGIQSTPGPRTMVKEEIDIAELRHKQLEELRKQRYKNREFRGKRRKGQKKRKNSVRPDDFEPRKSVLSLGDTEDGQALSVALTKRRRKKSQNKKKFPTDFVASRTSRVDTGISPYHIFHKGVNELKRRPVEEVYTDDLSNYDATCVERVFGRSLPKLAPQISNAFVYRYETKKNSNYPFNAYMLVKYRCLTSYHFANPVVQRLFCKEQTWMGEKPECVKNITRS